MPDKPKRYDRVRVSDNPRVGKSFAGITGRLDLHGRMHGYEDQGDLALVIRDGGGAVGPISYEDLTKIEEGVCPACSSKGFAPSKIPGRCEFCDGTVGGVTDGKA